MKTMAIIVAMLVVGCESEYRSERITTPKESDVHAALRKSGYSKIQEGGFPFPGTCSRSDDYGIEFKAVNPVGSPVEGVVCCGIFKGCTVRF